jgi:hypothetical protein
MVIMCLLLYRSRNIPATFLENKSLRVKTQLVLVNLVSFALAGYAFVRHNAYCEEGSKSNLLCSTLEISRFLGYQ